MFMSNDRYYYGYIYRGDDEIEVSARLYAQGEVAKGFDEYFGPWEDVIEDPVFTDFVAFDDYGVELVLTPKELLQVEQQMVKSYWDNWQGASE